MILEFSSSLRRKKLVKNVTIYIVNLCKIGNINCKKLAKLTLEYLLGSYTIFNQLSTSKHIGIEH